ncbi:MAG: zeta toxin family protein [Methylacidiphilales bacterium]|nr:zeta toxin family protein [Candidatus Methylacidiphilales bacterium]
MPNIFVIAGPNGAGKSTTARTLLPAFLNCVEFVNADDIAKGLSAFRPENVALSAGRIMLKRLDELARQHVDFAFETTLSSRTFAPWLRQQQENGFDVHLLFLWLPSAGMAVARVAARVQAGGHGVVETDIRRRYRRGLDNLRELYMPLANTWEVYDNSESEPRLIAYGGRVESLTILASETWQQVIKKPS